MSATEIREALKFAAINTAEVDTLAKAARAYADLLDNGEIRQWHQPMVFHVPGKPHLSAEFPPGRFIIAALPVVGGVTMTDQLKQALEQLETDAVNWTEAPQVVEVVRQAAEFPTDAQVEAAARAIGRKMPQSLPLRRELARAALEAAREVEKQ